MNQISTNPRMVRELRCSVAIRMLAGTVSITALTACGADEPSRDGNEWAGKGGAGGGGGRVGQAGTANGSDCPNPNETLDPTAMIDDLEDQDGLLLAMDGRNGGWWTAGDDTAGASMVPERTDVSDQLATPESIPGGRCGSDSAMRVTGQGFLDWGSVLGLSLVWNQTQEPGAAAPVPYDASSRTGIEFWARIGDTSTDQVRFAVSDVNNEPEGGRCDLDGGPETQCYDTFGTPILGLQTSWRHFRIPFSGLQQRDFGYPADAAVSSALFTAQFTFGANATFDFWVDDVAFY